MLEDFKARYAGFVVKNGTFRIPVDWEIDAHSVTDLVRARPAELE